MVSGGSLICCDLCPTAFHADCLKISPPEGGYICEDCETGRFPLYGEIVWVKLGVYRWWPAQIVFPHQIPENIQNLVHARGEFAVKFFGSHDFYWVNRGRVFLYQEGDSGGRCRSKNSGTDQVFLRAVEEASEAYLRLKNEKAFRDASNRSGMKPPSYIRIKTNKPVGQVRAMEANISNLTPCECDPNSANPCALDSDCLNRILMVECNPLICPAGEKCKNQLFEKRQYPPLMPYRTVGRGWGLKTLVDLKKGDFVIEYVGEMINETEYQRRLQKMHESNEDNYYFLTIDKDRMLDAGPKGNVARFMNHSCQPNCETQKWTVNGDTRVGLFALCDIPAESELVFNYNLESTGTEKKPCMCGAPNCSGFIGVKASKQNNGNGNNGGEDGYQQQKKPSRRSRSKQPAKLSDECCFLCGKEGELLLCDGKTCTKAYHLGCLNRNKKLPVGYWLCPWHQCNVCGKGKVARCNFCINSYCPIHAEGNIHLEESIGYVCSKHDKAERNKIDEKSKTPNPETISVKDNVTKESDVKVFTVTNVDLSLSVPEVDPSSSSTLLPVPNPETRNNNVECVEPNLKALSCNPRNRRSKSNTDVYPTDVRELKRRLSISKSIRRPASVDSAAVREVEVPLKETLLKGQLSKRRRSQKSPSPFLQESKNGIDNESISHIEKTSVEENETISKEVAKNDPPHDPSLSEKCNPLTKKSSDLNCNGNDDSKTEETNDILNINIESTFSLSNSPFPPEESETNETDLNKDESPTFSEVTPNHEEEIVKADSEIAAKKKEDIRKNEEQSAVTEVVEISKTDEKIEDSSSKPFHTQENVSKENSESICNDNSDVPSEICRTEKDSEVSESERLSSKVHQIEDETTEKLKKVASHLSEEISNSDGDVDKEVIKVTSNEIKSNGLAVECSETRPGSSDGLKINEEIKTLELDGNIDENSSVNGSNNENSEESVEDLCKTGNNDTVVDKNDETHGKSVITENTDETVMKKVDASMKKNSASELDTVVV